MSNSLFLDLFMLITYAVVLTIILTYVLFVFFLKKTMEQQRGLMDDFIGDDDAKVTTEQIDSHFGSSPVGIPPSLARD